MSAIYRKSAIQAFTIGSVILLLAGGSAAAYNRDRYHGGRDYSIYVHQKSYHPHFWVHGFNRAHYWGGFYIGARWFFGPTLVVAGMPYYYYNGYYYTPSGDCLIEVPQPVAEPPVAAVQSPPPAKQPAAAAPAQPAEKSKAAANRGDTVTINVPNSSGGYTSVDLVKTDKGYIGPEGEFYPNHPTVEELEVLYGD
jgi:hypothetical protein